MPETLYINIGYEEAVSSKKQILENEISILKIHKSIDNYKLLRKKELETKAKLKAALSSLKSEINKLISTLPEQEAKINKTKNKIIKIESIDKIKQKQAERNFQNDLEEIKRKLEKLG